MSTKEQQTKEKKAKDEWEITKQALRYRDNVKLKKSLNQSLLIARNTYLFVVRLEKMIKGASWLADSFPFSPRTIKTTEELLESIKADIVNVNHKLSVVRSPRW